jgi:hypothetical protein
LIKTSEKFPIALRRGWNLVGNPFNFPTFAEFATSAARPETLSIYAYENGQWSNPLNPMGNELLQPFTGYAVFCDTACTMFVNPDLFPIAAGLLRKESAAAAEGILWSIRILAQCGEAKDTNNLLAIVNGASLDWDAMDHPEPPVIGEYVSVYFPHPEWSRLSKSYCTDFRPVQQAGEEWDFAIETNICDEVKLSFEGIEDVPLEYDVWIVDKALKFLRICAG